MDTPDSGLPAVSPPSRAVELLPDPALPSLPRPLTVVGHHTYVAIWPYVRRQGRPASQHITRELAFVRDDGQLLMDSPHSGILELTSAGAPESLEPPETPHALPRSLRSTPSEASGHTHTHLNFPPVPDDRLWSAAGLQRYLNGERPDPAQIFGRLVAALQHFVDFTSSLAGDPALTAELLAAYLLTTWFAPAFPALPLLWVMGDHGAGKSRLLYLLSRLAHLGLLFPALPPPAALGRLAGLGASLAVDDAHFLSARFLAGGGFAFGSSARQALLLAGRQRGALLPASQSLAGPRLLDVFGPRLFASTHQPHPGLAAYCLLVPLVRTADPVRAALDPANPADWPSGLDPRALTDDLWALALSRLAELSPHLPLAAQAAASSSGLQPLAQSPVETASHLSPLTSHVSYPTSHVPLLGSSLQPWHALLSVASWLSSQGVPGLLDRLLTLARAYHAQRPAFQTADLTVLALQALFQCVSDDLTARATAPLDDADDANDGTLDNDPDPFRGFQSWGDAPIGPADDGGDGNDGIPRLPSRFEFTASRILSAMQHLAAGQSYDLPLNRITPAVVGRLLGHLRLDQRRAARSRAWSVTPAALARLARAYSLPVPPALAPFLTSHLPPLTSHLFLPPHPSPIPIPLLVPSPLI